MKTFALIGESGSGKSHHAFIVAKKKQIDLIIDDGILIKDGRILAGRSAKNAPTRLGAIKTALFTDDNHADQVSLKLQEEKFNTILILGTSQGMIMKICERLSLPSPTEWIKINEIASEEEIQKAKYLRKNMGTHVIPALTMEVEKRLGLSFIEPLTAIFRHKKHLGSENAALHYEQSIVRPSFNNLGRFYISEKVIHKTCQHVCQNIVGLDQILKTKATYMNQGIQLDLEISASIGRNLAEIGKEIQKETAKGITNLTALTIWQINVTIKKIMLPS